MAKRTYGEIPEFKYTPGEAFEVTDGMKDAFDRDGFILVRGLYSFAEIERLEKCLKLGHVTKHAFDLPDGDTMNSRMVVWNHPGVDYTGLFGRCRRVVDTTEKLLGGEVYHYHTKVNMKEPHTGGSFQWHQDYGYWYKNGILFPDLLSVMVAIHKCDRGNGCLKVSLKGADEPTKNEFKNEIEFLMKLRRNPYIVHLYDYQLTNDHIFLVLECGSTDLAKLIQSRKSQNSRLEIYEIRYFWKKMLHAVNTIHQHGVIHRDLKPANFVFVEGHLKLIDFGISNSIQSDATSIIKETQCGTLNYMAPEAIMDMSGGYNPEAPQFKISPRADVWSLGCILYSMMYGRTPFQHIKHQMLKLNAITNPQHRIEFPVFKDHRLWKIVQNCLQRNPKNRATVEQLLEFS